jgi:hypothetical protein
MTSSALSDRPWKFPSRFHTGLHWWSPSALVTSAFSALLKGGWQISMPSFPLLEGFRDGMYISICQRLYGNPLQDARFAL